MKTFLNFLGLQFLWSVVSALKLEIKAPSLNSNSREIQHVAPATPIEYLSDLEQSALFARLSSDVYYNPKLDNEIVCKVKDSDKITKK